MDGLSHEKRARRHVDNLPKSRCKRSVLGSNGAAMLPHVVSMRGDLAQLEFVGIELKNLGSDGPWLPRCGLTAMVCMR